MAETTHTEWRRGQFREQRDHFHCLLFNSSALYYLQTPTPPRLRNFFRYLAIGMCHIHYLWNGLCDRHRPEITVIQFIGHSLPVHHAEVGPSPCPILSAEHISFGMCYFRYLRNDWCDRHRSEITIIQFRVRIFTLSHIVSQAVFYTIIFGDVSHNSTIHIQHTAGLYRFR